MKRKIRLFGIRIPSLVLLLAVLALVGAACEETTGTDFTDDETIDPALTAPGEDTLPLDTLPEETLPTETTKPPETTEAAETTQPPETTDTTSSGTPVPAPISELAAADGRFSVLVELVEDAGLIEMLAGDEPVTLLAPTDEAFAILPTEELDALRADPDAVLALVQSHMVKADVAAEDLAEMDALVMTSGDILPIIADGAGFTIGGAVIVEPDIAASNGTIHVIDTVLIASSEG